MRSAFALEYDHETVLPDEFDGGDVRMPPGLVRRLLRAYTDRGDRVLDPFAGFGTTLVVAEDLGREAWGVEYDDDRAAHVRDRITDPSRLHRGSAADLPEAPSEVDCVLTSPPYMHESDTRNPLRNYEGQSDYDTYLDDLRAVFGGVVDRLHAEGTLLVEAANLKHDGRTTTFAWDLADTVRDLPDVRFAGEHVVSWEGDSDGAGTYGYGYDHSYVLVFERR